MLINRDAKNRKILVFSIWEIKKALLNYGFVHILAAAPSFAAQQEKSTNKGEKIEFLSGNRKGFGTQMQEKKAKTGKKTGLKTGTNREKTWQSEIRPQSFSLTEGFMNTITNELKKKWRNWREWEKKEFIISSWENQDLWNLVVLKFTLYCPPKKRHKKGFEKRQQWFFST